jgi:hypothetical protein
MFTNMSSLDFELHTTCLCLVNDVLHIVPENLLSHRRLRIVVNLDVTPQHYPARRIWSASSTCGTMSPSWKKECSYSGQALRLPRDA